MGGGGNYRDRYVMKGSRVFFVSGITGLANRAAFDKRAAEQTLSGHEC